MFVHKFLSGRDRDSAEWESHIADIAALENLNLRVSVKAQA